MQDRRAVSSPNAPAAIGPYSQAIVHAGLVWCSGQVALDPATKELVPGGIEEQTRQVLKNLGHVLAAAGTSFERVLKTTVFLQSMDDFAKMNAIYGTFFPVADLAGKGAPPARATVEVAKLPKGALVEIDCVAALPR
ncbi:MAG: RidA family protein [Planctomycetes bacterium]|nr:RidA family protein [Planctomycetota bacterium]